MSDVTINRFVASFPDAASRTAFVPTPPVVAGGPQSGYVAFQQDNGTLWSWDRTFADWVLVGTLGVGTGDVVGPASAIAGRVATFDGATGKLIKDGGKTIADIEADAASLVLPIDLATDTTGILPYGNLPPTVAISSLGITVDGGGSAITTGVKGYLHVPYACTITAVTLLADVSGSVVFDIWKAPYASYPPTVANTITGLAKPVISAALKAQDTALAGWITAIAAGDVLAFKVDSAATITRVTLTLTVTRM